MQNLLAAALLLAVAQAPALDVQQPRFRTGVNVVEVDVVVTDRAGRIVRGLTRDDFTVLEDGKPVEVATFEAFDIPAAPIDAPLPDIDRSGASVGTNDLPEDGRVVLIVLDDYHISFDAGRMALSRAAGRRLIERLGPSDLAAVMSTSGRAAARAEFTTDKGRLLQALDNLFPQSEVPAMGIAGERPGSLRRSDGNFGFVSSIKTRWAMDALSNAAKTLALIPNRRKTILLVSQGVPLSLEEIIRNPYAGDASQSLRDFVVTAQRSNVAIYPVDPCGLSANDAGCTMDSRNNLRSIAEATGGRAVVDSNDVTKGVDRLIEESGSYYLIGYYSPAPPNDGKRHRITVRTRVPGVTVRARDGYVAPRRAAKEKPADTPLERLIDAPLQQRGLPMRVSATPSAAPASGKSTLTVTIELPADEALAAEKIDFTVLVADSNGRPQARQRFDADFSRGSTDPATPARVATTADVGKGRYLVRVAGAAANGKTGSVFLEVDVPGREGDLAVGGLTLASETPVHLARSNAPADVPRVSAIASRDVPADRIGAAEISVRVDDDAASQPLVIESTLKRQDGTSMPGETVRASAADFTGRYGRVLRIPLPSPLERGDYRLTVTVGLGDDRVTRELPFTVSR